MRWTRWTLVLLAAALAGCASKTPSSVLAEGPRMIDLYRGTAASEAEFVARTDSERHAPPAPETKGACRGWFMIRRCERPEAQTGPFAGDDRIADAVSYSRTSANELEFLFPRLPNPDIYIYVAPHLATEERVPVPGYTTAVPLYERVAYALPGELERAMRRLNPRLDAEPAGSDGVPAGPVPEDGAPPEGGGATP